MLSYVLLLLACMPCTGRSAKPLFECPAPVHEAGIDYIEFEGRRYWAVIDDTEISQRVWWELAEETCHRAGAALLWEGHLVSIHTAQDLAFLRLCLFDQRRAASKSFFWLGYKVHWEEPGSYRSKWTDGSSTEFLDRYYMNFMDKVDQRYQCAVANTHDGNITFTDCVTKSFYYVCQLNVPCPDSNKGWTPGLWQDDKHYAYYNVTYKTWKEAEDFCNARDSVLPSVRNNDELAFLQLCMVDRRQGGNTGLRQLALGIFWLGYRPPEVTDSSKAHFTGVWTDGLNSSVADSWFQKSFNSSVANSWLGEEYKENMPYCATGRSNIVEFSSCDSSLSVAGVVCQKHGAFDCPPFVSSTAWMEFNTKSYIYELTKGNWMEAEEFCQKTGGHLVSVDGTKTLSFLRRCLIPSYHTNFDADSPVFIWVGYTDMGGASGRWTDGSEPNFANARLRIEGNKILSPVCGMVSTDKGILQFMDCAAVAPPHPHSNLGIVCQKPGCLTDITINCRYNCGTRINPSERMILSFDWSRCSDLGPDSLKFMWQFSSSNRSVKSHLVWDHETRTGNAEADILIEKDVFPADSPDTEYTLNLTVQKATSTLSANVLYKFTINSVPRGGHCDIEPKEGVTLATKFNITCNNFTDDDQPLKYIYRVFLGENLQVLHPSVNSSIPLLDIPMGEELNDFVVRIAVSVVDSAGATATLYTSVTVKPDYSVTEDPAEWKRLRFNALFTNLVTPPHDHLFRSGSPVTLGNDIGSQLTQVYNAAYGVPNRFKDQGNVIEAAGELIPMMVKSTCIYSPVDLAETSSTILKVSQQMTTKNQTVQYIEKNAKDCVNSVSLIMYAGQSIYRKSMNMTNFQRSTKMIMSTLDNVKIGLARTIVPGNRTNHTIVADLLTVSVQKSYKKNILCMSDNTITLPCSLELPLEADELSIEKVYFTENPYLWTDTEVNSGVYSFDIRDSKSETIVQLKNLKEPVKISFPLDITSDFQGLNLTKVQYAHITIPNVEVDESLYIVLRLPNETTSAPVEFYVRSNGSDISNEEDVPLNKRALGHLVDLQASGVFNMHSALLQTGGECNLTVLLANSSQQESLAVEVMTLVVRCVFWDSASEAWSSEGCRPQSMLALSVLQCECDHLSTYAAGIFVKVNEINYADIAQFLTFWKNPIGVIIVVILVVMYILATIWGRRIDRRRAAARKAIDLLDNDPYDKYIYIVILETGSNVKRPPTCLVSLILKGSLGLSEPHGLQCSTHRIFKPGATNYFVVRTPQSLGNIETISLWHDAKGDYPHWFVQMCLVYDPQQHKKWPFRCDSWLSPDLGEKKITKQFNVSDKSVTPLLYRNTTFNMKDEHLYLSLFKAPHTSRFTMCQRLACILCLFMLGMLTNIMFYNKPQDVSDTEVRLGNFFFSTHSLMISLQTALIMVPATVVVAKLFQVSRPRHPVFIVKEAMTADDIPSEFQMKASSYSSSHLMEESLEKVNQQMNMDAVLHWHKMNKSYRRMSIAPPEDTEGDNTWRERGRSLLSLFSLPWWCVYIAWCLVLGLAGICAFYTILYTFNYGHEKSMEWFCSVLLTQVLDIVVLDPFKIVVLATLASCIFRRYYIEELVNVGQFRDASSSQQEEKEDTPLQPPEAGSRAPPGTPTGERARPIDDMMRSAIAASRRQSLAPLQQPTHDTNTSTSPIWSSRSLSSSTSTASGYVDN